VEREGEEMQGLLAGGAEVGHLQSDLPDAHARPPALGMIVMASHTASPFV
jgi:hypothetical protein